MVEKSKKLVYVDEHLLDMLEPVAQSSSLSLSALLDSILRGFISDNKIAQTYNQEKRKFSRKSVVMPAMVYEKSGDTNVGRYFSTTILDLSIGGTRMAFPIERDQKIEFIKTGSNFEIILYLSDSRVLSRFKCRLKHVEKKDFMINVGGEFVESDDFSHEQLHSFMTQ
ncbi:MAG: PilZ domain-containing protein [Desulfonatronovibrionaceae bacterium]